MITRAIVLLSLVLIGAFDAPTGTDGKSPTSKSRMLALASNGCNACRMHEEIRALSLEAIKEQILNKLGLKQAPNMTGRALPRIPPISKLMDMYGMQADQPQTVEPGITHHEEIDEYAAKTESVFALAQPHYYFVFLVNWKLLIGNFVGEYIKATDPDLSKEVRNESSDGGQPLSESSLDSWT